MKLPPTSMIKSGISRTHWNYYIAIEEDLLNTSRYVEFCEANLGCFSIEFAHILLSASSEVDVLLKMLCELISPGSKQDNINDYRAIIMAHCPEISAEQVHASRYGLDFQPWINWLSGKNPDWWKSYNNVKHTRDISFAEANLHNTLNAVGALNIVSIFYYKYLFLHEFDRPITNLKEVTYRLNPKPQLLTLNEAYYHKNIVA